MGRLAVSSLAPNLLERALMACVLGHMASATAIDQDGLQAGWPGGRRAGRGQRQGPTCHSQGEADGGEHHEQSACKTRL